VPKKETEKVWLDSMEAAAYIGQSLRWIRRAVVEQTIPYYKMVGTVRFKRTELDEWLEQRRVEVAPRRRSA
jgi:excisionase family DNA binding protein